MPNININITSPPEFMIINFFTSTRFSPTDGTTYYFGGNTNVSPQTTKGFADFIAPCDLTIKAVYFVTTQGAGSNENVTYNFITNEVTSTLIATSQLTATRVTGSNNSLNISVSAGQAMTIEMICPVWATNPNNFSGSFAVLVQKS